MSTPSDTPRTDWAEAVWSDTIPANHLPSVDAEFCRKLERESDRRLKILRDLMPFVLEGYYPECATQEFKAAVEAAKAEVAT